MNDSKLMTRATGEPAPAPNLFAHSANAQGEFHSLFEHLNKVAQLAGAFSAAWGDPFFAQLAGAWHDFGKGRAGFQRHIRIDRDAHVEGKVPGAEKTHSAAGALHAQVEFARKLDARSAELLSRVLQYLIAGHHAGLADWQPQDGHAGLAPRLASAAAQLEYGEALKGLAAAGCELDTPPDAETLSAGARMLFGKPEPLARSLALRMLFSALVDADFLDTESHFDADKAASRTTFPPITRYAEQLQIYLAAMAERVQASGEAHMPVMQARAEVQRACIARAQEPPGVFTLTVPTGGGKTLSSLAFALEHARLHQLRRVVYAIPYTSIIEQTAAVFAGIFGAEQVVEHHSQVEAAPSSETTASRLACENWDAPLIVTTNVQLFESLFAAATSRCRKLHRLAGSVIVLDEAQMLPPAFLQPILDTLKQLLAHYRISLVLCTATQPVLTSHSAFDPRQALRGLPEPKSIVEPGPLFAALRRTQIHWPSDLHTVTELPALAERVQQAPCGLAILNTRADAMELAKLLPREHTRHLSAALCGAHRTQVIAEIRDLLKTQAPLHVVSTQVIEAGVDVDFPVVWRALAGLDSIAQAAGRCNREGRRAQGDVHVVVRPIPKPLGLLRTAADTTRSLHAEGLPDALVPAAFERYFRTFYARQDLDKHRIVELLSERDGPMEFNFRSAATKFRLIDDQDQCSLLIPLHRLMAGHDKLAPLIAKLQAGDADRWLLRSVQRFVLSIRQQQLDELLRTGAVEALSCGLSLLIDDTRYDRRFGLLPRDNPLDAQTMVQ